MRKRDRAAASTRTSIINAAHSLLNHGENTSLTVQEIADAAGVSRATVYKSIGSRRELLAAVLEDQGRLIKFERVLIAARLESPRRAITATVRESCRAYSVMPDAIRKTLALAVLDPVIGELARTYELYRRGEMAQLAERVFDAGVMHANITRSEAVTTLALLTGFPTYDQLRLQYDARETATILVRITQESLGIEQMEEVP